MAHKRGMHPIWSHGLVNSNTHPNVPRQATPSPVVAAIPQASRGGRQEGPAESSQLALLCAENRGRFPFRGQKTRSRGPCAARGTGSPIQVPRKASFPPISDQGTLICQLHNLSSFSISLPATSLQYSKPIHLTPFPYRPTAPTTSPPISKYSPTLGSGPSSGFLRF